MTYEEVVLRMVRLMYVSHEGRWWVDMSLRNLTGDWLRRVEERFAGVNGGGGKPSFLQSFTALDDPLPFVDKFFEAYPLATEQLLASEDKAYFLTISQRPGQKPVPLIPVLDASFEVWFKKVGTREYCLFPIHIISTCRTLCGPPRTLKLYLIKTLNEFASCKDRLP
jgi:fatty acid synthase subunit alpha, fungi type